LISTSTPIKSGSTHPDLHDAFETLEKQRVAKLDDTSITLDPDDYSETDFETDTHLQEEPNLILNNEMSSSTKLSL